MIRSCDVDSGPNVVTLPIVALTRDTRARVHPTHSEYCIRERARIGHADILRSDVVVVSMGKSESGLASIVHHGD